MGGGFGNFGNCFQFWEIQIWKKMEIFRMVKNSKLPFISKKALGSVGQIFPSFPYAGNYGTKEKLTLIVSCVHIVQSFYESHCYYDIFSISVLV
jgi:hypothetical protein